MPLIRARARMLARGEEISRRSPSPTPKDAASEADNSAQTSGDASCSWGARVEMVDGAPRVEQQRVLLVRILIRRDVLGRLQERFAGRVGRHVLRRLPGGAS